MDAVSEDSSGRHFRQAARKRVNSATIGDLTLMVKVPGQPAAIRVFTATEDAEARQYATEMGGIVVPLPLAPPRGYVVGSDGHLIPERVTADTSMANLGGPTNDVSN